MLWYENDPDCRRKVTMHKQCLAWKFIYHTLLIETGQCWAWPFLFSTKMFRSKPNRSSSALKSFRSRSFFIATKTLWFKSNRYSLALGPPDKGWKLYYTIEILYRRTKGKHNWLSFARSNTKSFEMLTTFTSRDPRVKISVSFASQLHSLI